MWFESKDVNIFPTAFEASARVLATEQSSSVYNPARYEVELHSAIKDTSAQCK